MNSDFAELLQAFENYEVEYLVVGGYAVMAYAEPRFTKDFDVWVNTVGKTLRKFTEPLLSLEHRWLELSLMILVKKGLFSRWVFRRLGSMSSCLSTVSSFLMRGVTATGYHLATWTVG
jgi:hypothetical protein